MNSMKGDLIDRRQLVQGIAAGVISPSSIASALGSTAELATIAAAKGITFGSQIASDSSPPPTSGFIAGPSTSSRPKTTSRRQGYNLTRPATISAAATASSTSPRRTMRRCMATR